MASNPYVNKVIYGNDTIMDISDTTAEESDVAEGEVFYKGTGERSVGTGSYYSPSDTAETDIQDDDYFPYYDTSALAKVKTLWSNIKSKLKSYFDGYYAYSVIRSSVTVAAGGSVRIPASGTDSHIKTTSIVIPVTDQKSTGVPYRYKSITVNAGYVTIVMAEAISNIQVGVVVINN